MVVSAPTSSGKTLIAEAAAVATVARGRRLFYTTPLKALSNQKFREFRFVSPPDSSHLCEKQLLLLKMWLIFFFC